MPGFDDIELDHTSPSGPPRPRRPAWWPWAAGAGIVVLVAVLVWQSWRQEPESPRESAAEIEEPAPVLPELGAPADQVTLPPLDDSDAFVRQLVAGLSSHPRLAAWLVPNNLIDRFVAVVDNVADGRRPTAHLRALAPAGPFRVIDSGSSASIDPRNYLRYDAIADVVSSVDAAGAARLYTLLKPLLDEAYRQLGYPDRRFDDTVARAIQRLLDTPVPAADVRVIASEANYEYADPMLEAQSPVAKQFMRMGPRNVRMIQDKAREIARELGLDRVQG